MLHPIWPEMARDSVFFLQIIYVFFTKIDTSHSNQQYFAQLIIQSCANTCCDECIKKYIDPGRGDKNVLKNLGESQEHNYFLGILEL